MSSFYGNAGIIVGGGDGSGTNDYNELKNLPFKNITGTTLSPIDFSVLNYGNYVLQGKYTYGDTEVQDALAAKIVQVFQDTQTGKRIVKFELFEEDTYYVVSLIYNSDGTYVEEKYSPYQNFDTKIEEAKNEAINVANNYTIAAMTITEF